MKKFAFIVSIMILLLILFTIFTKSGDHLTNNIQTTNNAKTTNNIQTTNNTSSNNNKWQYTFKEPLNATVIYADKMNFNVMGYPMTAFTWMPEDAYPNYLSIINSGQCPAHFLQGNTHIYVFFTEDPNILETISQLKRGAKLTLSGNYLDNVITTPNGQQINMGLPNGGNYIYIKGIYLN